MPFSKSRARSGRDSAGAELASRLDAVTKVYGRGPGTVTALDNVTLGIHRGSFTAVMGPSGSGKSTFLHCAAGLDRPTSGVVHLGDVSLSGLNEAKLTELRRSRVGFVFQSFNLMPSLTVQQNINLPHRLSGTRAKRDWQREVIGKLGLADRLGHRPAQLSGGQQQRVAIARALVTQPDVLFADEPTGALDVRTAQQILMLLRSIVDEMGQTVVMVTHDPVAASYADSVLFLTDGRIVDSMIKPGADRIAEHMTRLEVHR
ncbi:ABC transporter ATP-binding protein [Spirillospora sp. NPDC047279]|uniref:ABC transporter ATP-binding protein n=1 Tax=Spirillospora sp. NPDC047279 TaxID=3155478 RepID=UPI0033DE2D85